MKTQRVLVAVLVLAFMLALSAGLIQASGPAQNPAPLGTAFTYQGQLKQGGNPVDGTCDLQFSLWDAVTGGTQVGSTQTKTGVSVSNGMFAVVLDFGAAAFGGDARWLEVSVRSPAGSGDYTTLSPRQALTAAPYALYAKGAPWNGLTGVPVGFADGVDNDTTYTAGAGLALSGNQFGVAMTYCLPQTCSNGQIAEWNGTTWVCGEDDTGIGGGAWLLTGNGGTTPGTHFLGTTDNVTLTLVVSGTAALRLGPNEVSPNVIGGYSGNSSTVGVYGATIGGGGETSSVNCVNHNFGTIGGGAGNAATAYATVGGGVGNYASNYAATVGGGAGNDASGYKSTVAGGEANSANNRYTTVGGGSGNSAGGYGFWATAAGGKDNAADGNYATVSGGEENSTSANWATIGGGESNAANGEHGTVAGGHWNIAGYRATVSGGEANFATGEYATVSGGDGNRASDQRATVGGGLENHAAAATATIGGGEYISVTGKAATVAGGSYISAAGDYAAVGGGKYNTAVYTYTTVGGGYGNTASGYGATVGGGGGDYVWMLEEPASIRGLPNNAAGQWSTVGGGAGNTASRHGATVGGGGGVWYDRWGVADEVANSAEGAWSTVGGGLANVASGFGATVAGGGGGDFPPGAHENVLGNTALGDYSTVGGGVNNLALGDGATVAGGSDNTASGYLAVVGGGGGLVYDEVQRIWHGFGNVAEGDSATVGGGWNNSASGEYATVPGGDRNTAQGDYSFAAGRRAKADHDGSFVWADSTDADFASTAQDQFAVRAAGGVTFDTGYSTVTIKGGNALAASSDGTAVIGSSHVGYGVKGLSARDYGGYFSGLLGGVYGEAYCNPALHPGPVYGVYGKASGTVIPPHPCIGIGVYGEGSTTGVQGVGGTGVHGEGDTGVYGEGGDHGGYFTSTSESGVGVYGGSGGTSYGAIGVKGTSSYGTGVYGVGGDTGVYGEGAVGGSFRATGDGTALETQGRAIVHGDLQVTGNLTVTGQVSGFPRPNFDSGWVYVTAGGSVTITHNLGGDPEDYVVDMTFRDNVLGSGIHQITYGGDVRPGSDDKGMWWERLDTTLIMVLRSSEDVRCQDVRIRIWVYK